MSLQRNRINRISDSAKASFWFIASNLVLKGISFITTPIFTRLLDVADYGTTSIYMTWEGIISFFATLSLFGGVYNVAMAKYQNDIDAYTSSMYILESILCIVVYSIVAVFNLVFPNIFNLSNVFVAFMGLQTLTNAFSTFWLMRLRYSFKYKPVIAFTFANAIIGPVLAIIAIKLFPNDAAFAKIVGAGIFGIVFGFVLFIWGIKKGHVLISKKYWRYAIGFNLPLLPHYLSGIILGSADRIMIDNMVNRIAAGIYSISNSIAGCLGIITGSINSVMIPVTIQALKSGNLNGLKNKIVSYMLIIAFVCCGIMLFSHECVLLFASYKYLDSIPFVPPLTIAAFLEYTSGIVGNMQFYYEKRWGMSFSTVVTSLLNIGLNYFGIRLFGAIAAAYTTLITSIIHFALYYYFSYKYINNINDIISLPILLVIFCGLLGYAAIALLFDASLMIRSFAFIVPLTAVIIKRKKIAELIRNNSRIHNE